ncbi:MAG: HNH endonuclease, partial [Nocardioides sp.]|nr:HNH endonuclease [Nocardioides sp.]
MALRDRGCTADGCDMPPGLCHAHHDVPWSHGGPTSLDNGRLLCHRHHRLAHDQRYTTTHTPTGKTTFHRRE